jgi:hypothetical protein
MKRLMVIEDGDEYVEFVRLFLTQAFAVTPARSAREALTLLRQAGADALLLDLRFDRSTAAELVGDMTATAARLFAGDHEQALRYLRDQQGTLILAELRAAGFLQPAVFVHDFPPRRLANLRRLYGDVRAVPSFDAALLGRVLTAPAPGDKGTPPP